MTRTDAAIVDFARGRWTGALLGVIVLLAGWPALWNGFPILMGDSLRYLSEAQGEPSWVSSQFYGYLLWLLRWAGLWGPITVQAVAATLVPWVFLRRAVGLQPRTAAGMTALTLLVTPLAFFASLVMADVWFGLGLLAVVTLTTGRELRRAEQAGLAVVVAYGAAAHPAALPLLVAVVVVAGLAAILARRRGTDPPAMLWASAALISAIAAVMINNVIVWGTASPNPHSTVVAFAYLLTHGDLDDELAACDGTPVCDLEERPGNINQFNRFLFSPEGPLETTLGGPEAVVDAATHVVVSHVLTDPIQYGARILSRGSEQLTRTNAWGHAARQMGRLGGAHVDRLDSHAAGDGARLARSRQFQETLDLGWHHAVNVWAGLLGMLSALGLVGAAVWRRRHGIHAPMADRLAAMLGILASLYVAHAYLISTTTFPVERYGGRVLWLLGLGACAIVGASVDAVIRRREARPTA